jgi:1-deoxy-D-xylulose-5-phosphate reductoisomerase
MKRITILGSTGSIGTNTLSILSQYPDKFEVFALTAQSNMETLFNQCLKFNPSFAVIEDEEKGKVLQARLSQSKLKTKALSGTKALQEVASCPDVDYVMAAIVGSNGLLPALAAAKAGKRILLANKEVLVTAGALFMEAAKAHHATLLPVDSEHNALFQCMPPGYIPGNRPPHLEKVILTASGGPFRTLALEQFKFITPEEAIAHPNWKMGPKISVDSATMMNKGFELIEAYWLFNLDLSAIEVVVHPESVIHAIACYEDGSMLAQLGSPDMRIPIAYTLSWPERIRTDVKRLNLLTLGRLHFEEVDTTRFPCMALSYHALKAGGTATALLNAANEEAVAAFLAKRIPFSAIYCTISEVLERLAVGPANTFDAVLNADHSARMITREIIAGQ